MSKQTINIGASPNDGTGTPLRTSFDYTNQNFTEIYTALGGGVALPGATTQVIFNDGGTNLAGDAGLVYNKTTDALTVAGLVTAGSATITGDLTVRTDKLVVTSTGAGFGTATPGTSLEVWKDFIRVNSDVASGVYGTQFWRSGVERGRYGFDFSASLLELQADGDIRFLTGGENERYRIDGTGISTWSVAGTTAMTLNSTGLGIGVAPVTGAKLAVAGPIVRNKGTVTATISVATTFATLPGEGLYIVYAYTNASNPAAFTSYAVILADSSGSRVVANNGTQITITTSTFALEVTQIFFPSVTILWSYVQIG